MSDLLTIPEVAEALRVSRRSVDRLIEQGRIRVVRPTPRSPRVERRELEAYRASLRKVA